ncbi:hypothetical protein ACT1UH_02545 [Mycoplasma sp. 332]
MLDYNKNNWRKTWTNISYIATNVYIDIATTIKVKTMPVLDQMKQNDLV